MQNIPLLADSAYRFSINLAGTSYIFDVTWNSEHEYYVLAIRDNSENLLISSLKLELNSRLISKYVDPSLPNGELVVVDTSGKLDKISFDSFTASARLVFIPEDELETIEGG